MSVADKRWPDEGRRGVCVKRHSFERLKRMCLQCTHWPIIEYSKMYSSR